MHSYFFQQGYSMELEELPFVNQFGYQKNSIARPDSFPVKASGYLSIYHIIDGKFEWMIDNGLYHLLPGHTIVVLPHQSLGSPNSVLEIGRFCWIQIRQDYIQRSNKTNNECLTQKRNKQVPLKKIIYRNTNPVIKQFPEADKSFKLIYEELSQRQMGYQAIILHQLDNLLIKLARCILQQNPASREFPPSLKNLETMLQQKPSYQWTVEEMAALAGLSPTGFNEKFKSYSGFSPIHYLINLRVREGIKLLQRNINLTDIALETGFYSSQHFSTTFKRITGYTPSHYKKHYLLNMQ